MKPFSTKSPLTRLASRALLAVIFGVLATAGTWLVVDQSAGAEVRLPHTDPQAPIEGYPTKAPWSCSPTFRAGSQRFADLLSQMTLHQYPYGGARSCGASHGAAHSYHKTGLAVDFSVDSRNPATRADGMRILEWLFAEVDGQPHANLRRLGVVEIIWDAKMWSSESTPHITSPNPADWPNYTGLGCRQSQSQATACHYDHFHFTLSGEAGAGTNSFWSGPVEVREPIDLNTLVSFFRGQKARFLGGEPVAG